MKPWEKLGEAHAPDGTRLSLQRRDREYVILADGKVLMSSRMHGSEEALATLACAHLARAAAPRVLVSGLGLGYTLRATLDVLPASAVVVVAELMPAVVEWNRGPVGQLAGNPLDDRRVQVDVGDVADTMRAATARFDAIMLDVDNGPDAFTTSMNDGLYTLAGLQRAHAALRPGGVFAVWSVQESAEFERRLRRTGFKAEVHRVGARGAKGAGLHTLFLGRR